MEDVVVVFKKNNPSWTNVRVFVIDKDFRERSILRTHFPDARILLCHYHVIKVFAKKVRFIAYICTAEPNNMLMLLMW
jgi:hypothetical protein